MASFVVTGHLLSSEESQKVLCRHFKCSNISVKHDFLRYTGRFNSKATWLCCKDILLTNILQVLTMLIITFYMTDSFPTSTFSQQMLHVEFLIISPYDH